MIIRQIVILLMGIVERSLLNSGKYIVLSVQLEPIIYKLEFLQVQTQMM